MFIMIFLYRVPNSNNISNIPHMKVVYQYISLHVRYIIIFYMLQGLFYLRKKQFQDTGLFDFLAGVCAKRMSRNESPCYHKLF